MDSQEPDPLVARAVADAVVERAANELKKLIKQLALAFDPFPGFMGLNTVQAIEVEPSGTVNTDLGCIVICPDGELREFVLQMVPGPIDVGGVDNIEQFKDIELSHGDFVAYAYAAVQQLTTLLEDKTGE